jgi:predicted transcriptional regulator
VIDGRRLREVRQQRGLSQSGLATLAGVSLRTVGHLDREDRPVCQGWTLGKLAAALGEEPAVFFISDKK